MSFTYIGEKADKKIQEKLNIIVDSIKREIPSTLSIILGGSFGYGEGPVKVESGKVWPFNDFDIYVIAKEKIDKDKFDDIALKIGQSLQIQGTNYSFSFSKENQTLKDNFFIDLKCFTLQDLPKLLPRLRYCQLKRNSQILWGKNLNYLIPEFQLNEILIAESTKILLDRMSQLIEFYAEDSTKYCQDYLTYIIQQAYAACRTSLLVLSGEFKPKYSEANKILLQKYNKMAMSKILPNLDKRIDKFFQWRMDTQKKPVKDIQEAWQVCAEDIIEIAKYHISKITKWKINSAEELSAAILKLSKYYHRPYLENLIENRIKIKINKSSNLLYYFLSAPLNLFFKIKYLERVKKQSGKYYLKLLIDSAFPDLRIYSVAPYLLASQFNQNLNKNMLILAKKELKRVYPCQGETWDEISIDYANAYISFFLQKLI